MSKYYANDNNIQSKQAVGYVYLGFNLNSPIYCKTQATNERFNWIVGKIITGMFSRLGHDETK